MSDFSSDEDNALAIRCYELNRIANKIKDLLKERFSSLSERGSVYTFKNRVKPPESILSKVKRKRSEEKANPSKSDGEYSPDNVSDVWGCRFVTLYQMQIPLAMKDLLSDLDQFNATAQSPIELVEFIIYTNRPPNDPLSIVKETQNFVRVHNITSKINVDEVLREPESRKSAYSSVHLTFSINIDFTHAGKSTQKECCKFEIQIRDIFEDGWGEIQHQLLYSEKDKLDLPEASEHELDPFWQPHLNALKTFVDGCSQHASIIKKTYDLVRRKRMPVLDNKSATYRPTDRDAIVQTLRDTSNNAYISDVEEAYRIIIQAEAIENRDESRALYTNAAVILEQILRQIPDVLDIPVKNRFETKIKYFLKIEYANSLYLSRDPFKLDEAISVYKSLMEEFPGDPLVKLRLSLAMQADDRDNIESLSYGEALVFQALSQIPNDPLTGSSHWISISSYLHIGFINWRLYTISNDEEKRHDYLQKAIGSSIKAYDYWRGFDDKIKIKETYRFFAHRTLSNLLYYGAAYIMGEYSQGAFTKDDLEHFISAYEEVDVPDYWEAYRARDNLMHAMLSIGRVADGRQLAKQNQTELKRRAEVRAGKQLRSLDVERFLTEDEKPNYRAAANVLADPEGVP